LRLADEAGLFGIGGRAIGDELRGGAPGLQEEPRLAEAIGIFERDLEATVGLSGQLVVAPGDLLHRAVAHVDDRAQLAGGAADGHAGESLVEGSTVEHALAGARTAAVHEGHLGGASSADAVLAGQRAAAVAVVAARGTAEELAVDAPAEQARQDDREHVRPHG
jgi:hypothetical protein